MVFYDPCNITGVIYEVVGLWVVVVRWWGVGKPKVGSSCHYGTVSCAVSSVGERNAHNPQDRSRWTLTEVLAPHQL